MNNIFKDSKFGDKFKTRSGLTALVLGVYPETQTVCCALEDGTIESEYRFDGTLPYEDCKDEEIVTSESLDEEVLDKLAEDYAQHRPYDDRWSEWLTCKKAFIAGFRKAKEI